MSEFLGHSRELEWQRLLLRTITDPMWFVVEVLGYDKMDEEDHKPLLEDMWSRFLRRPLVREAIQEQVDSKILHPIFIETALKAGKPYKKHTGLCIPRSAYKTTMKIGECGMEILLWPELRISHWHAVEEKAVECARELGSHFQENTDFRKIRPDIMPPPKSRKAKFCTDDGFRVKTRRIIAGRFAKEDRHPTFFPKGAKSTVTGGHCDKGWMDDIVDQKTIDDSQMPKIRSWVGDTVGNVVDGWQEITYTPWDEDDVMVDFENHPDWDVHVCGAMMDEATGKPVEEGGTLHFYSKEKFEAKRRDVNMNFPYQVLCIRTPDSERRWPEDWNGRCTIDWAMAGPGEIFVLSDPAPMGLSLHGHKDKVRDDTGKDWWSIETWRIRPREHYHDFILLEAAHSQHWPDDAGYDEAVRMMKRWNTRYFFDEDYKGGAYFKCFLRACERASWWPYLEVAADGKRRWPRYNEMYQAQQKNKRFQKFCDAAKRGEIHVADTVADSFLYGPLDPALDPKMAQHVGLLTQAEKFIPRRNGESNLKWDDDLDAAARVTDTKLMDFVPRFTKFDVRSIDPRTGQPVQVVEEPSRCRYIAGV